VFKINLYCDMGIFTDIFTYIALYRKIPLMFRYEKKQFIQIIHNIFLFLFLKKYNIVIF